MKQYYVWIEKINYGSVVVKAKSSDEAKNYLQNNCEIVEQYRETYNSGKVIKVEDMNGLVKYYNDCWKEEEFNKKEKNNDKRKTTGSNEEGRRNSKK